MNKTDHSVDAEINLAFVRGRLLGALDIRTLPDGQSVASFDVGVSVEDGPDDAVPVVVRAPSAAVLKLTEGVSVVVAGRVRRRFFRSGGRTQSRTEVVADRVVRSTATKQVTALRSDLIASVSAA